MAKMEPGKMSENGERLPGIHGVRAMRMTLLGRGGKATGWFVWSSDRTLVRGGGSLQGIGIGSKEWVKCDTLFARLTVR